MKTAMALGVLLIFIGFATSSDGYIVKPGASISAVTTAMTNAGYEETVAAFESADEDHALRMWQVGDGVLICTFASDSNTITALSYFLCDERPKSLRKDFDFPVNRFSPQSGVMEIVVAKGSESKDAK